MLLLDLDGKYADTAERALYNGALSGLSLDGTHFFYENPLQISRQREKAYRAPHHRQDWFDCACCPSNISRLIAQLGSFIYASDEESLVVHHFIQSRATLKVGETEVGVVQETNYPWEGEVKLVFSLAQPTYFTLKLHIPGCCRGPILSLNGREVENTPVKGYIGLEREWKDGDELILDLDMPVYTVYADPRVTADLGKVALQRGPLVYCLEGVDNDGALDELALPRSATLETRFEPDLLGGVVTIRGDALRIIPEPFKGLVTSAEGNIGLSQGLYFTEPPLAFLVGLERGYRKVYTRPNHRSTPTLISRLCRIIPGITARKATWPCGSEKSSHFCLTPPVLVQTGCCIAQRRNRFAPTVLYGYPVPQCPHHA